MKFMFNLVYWMVTIPILALLIFYVPVFAFSLLGVVLVIALIIAITVLVYRHKHK